MFFKSLETERLILKNIDAGDADFIIKQFSDDEVNRFLFDAEPITTDEQAMELIDFYLAPEPRNQHRWILTLKDGGERIGTCGFHCWNRESGVCEIGYDLYPPYQKKGYMSEALKAALSFAEGEMKIKEIHAHIAEGNTASFKIAEKFGFADSGQTYMEIFRGKEYPHSILIYKAPKNN
ncbi:MAG: GNAT family N-acetyltransferase [Eubacteriaceae bacterium]|nr:GNAT family N-acetyltransferase [Eubacteriaceae bacterium]